MTPVSVVIRLGALLLLSALAACTVHVSTGTVGVINGRDIEKDLDSNLLTFVKSTYPSFRAQPSKCPETVDVSHGKTGRCSMTVEGVTLPIWVRFNGPPDRFKANFDGSLYDRATDQRFIETTLMRKFGIRATAHCHEPIITTRRAGTKFNCAVAGSRAVSTVQVLANADGLFMFDPPGLARPSFESTAISRHRANSTVLISKAHLESIIGDFVAGEGRAAGMTARLGRPTCPIYNNLTGVRHVVCTVPIQSHVVRYDVSISNKVGFQINVLDAVLSTKQLVQLTERTLNQQRAINGDPANVSVDCGNDETIVAPVNGEFKCKVYVDGKSGHFSVLVRDSNGVVNFGHFEMDP